MKTVIRLGCLLAASLTMTAMAQESGDEPEGAEALLAVLDRNGDGELSQNEIDMAIVVLRRMDENGDGTVAKDEMVAPPRRPGGPGGAGRGPGGPGGRRGPGGPPPWAEIDANGDGKISKEEAPERMQDFFDRMDRDGDGFIDKQEQEALNQRFRGRGGQDRPQPGGEPGERPRPEGGRPGAGSNRGGSGRPEGGPPGGGLPPWDQLDGDGDGKISREEAPAPMKQRFDRLDQNKDGFIDKKEQESVNEIFRRQRGRGEQGGPPGGGRPGAGRGRGDAFKVLAEKYDRDGDGAISEKEYTRSAERFASLDRNNDGKLTAADYEGRRRGGGGVRRPSEGELPQAGDPAPDFELAYAKEKDKTVKLSGFAGKRPVALVFGSYT